jgi:hypothetical protein
MQDVVTARLEHDAVWELLLLGLYVCTV